MVNLWHKYKIASKRKKQALHSLIAGLVIFCLLCVITRFFKVGLCPIKAIFDVPCPGCGLMRGFISVFELDFKSAIEYNVLSIPLFVGILIYSIMCVVDIVFDLDGIEWIEKQLNKFISKIFLLVLYILYICFFYLKIL